jgi:hypothetical protein
MNTNAEELAQQIYDRLPAVYRLRDAEVGFPLRELVAVVAEQTAVVQESLEQAYDDLFIETCAQWVVPYIGDLIGARPLHGKAPGAAGGRAEVAETLGLRRRKGTLAALEQTARVVTGYPAVAVEFFTRLLVTQYVQNHVRLENRATIDVRDELALERLNTAFDSSIRTLEVRRIASGRGRYNIPNIGLFLFRIQSYRLRGATAARVDDFRYTFNPLGIDTALYNDPRTETEITQFARPENVPLPISRVAMKQAMNTAATYYGANAAMLLSVNGVDVPESDVVVCNLSDLNDGSGNWAHTQTDKYGIDPVLGRIALPTNDPAPAEGSVIVNFRYGFSDALGGGEYERGADIAGTASETISATAPDVQLALDAVAGGGIVEFADSRTYTLASTTPNLAVNAGQRVEVRAVNGARPVIQVTGGDLVIDGDSNTHIVLNGLVIAGGAVRITGSPETVTLRHCTLVPGIARTRQNDPEQPDAPSLIVESDNVTVTLDRCIVGPILASNGCTVVITHSIIDATDEERVAFSAGNDGSGATLPGGTLRIENSTAFGRVHTQQIERASNVIFAARVPSGDAALPVRSERTQQGCVRFSVVPPRSRTPKRYRCVTEAARFTSTRFGTPGYCQLSRACAESIRRGADDESEIGVFHDLYQPQRESDLWTRLDEFLRFGMEAGVFYAS